MGPRALVHVRSPACDYKGTRLRMGNPENTTLSWHCMSPISCEYEILRTYWLSAAGHLAAYSPREGWKELGQHGGMQTSCSVRKELSWHKEFILKKINAIKGNKPCTLYPVAILVTVSQPYCQPPRRRPSWSASVVQAHTVLIAALRTSIQLHHPFPHQELLGALLPAFPRSCFFPWKPGLQFRLSGWEPDVWQVQEQSLCPRVNLNFCGFFFLKHRVGILHVNTSGKKIRFNNAYTEKGIPGALHSWATRLLPASDTWRTAGFSKTPEQIAWFSEVLCL